MKNTQTDDVSSENKEPYRVMQHANANEADGIGLDLSLTIEHGCWITTMICV